MSPENGKSPVSWTAVTVCIVALFGLAAWVLWPGPVIATAAPPAQTTHPPTDLACRLCHGDSTGAVEFPSGESLPVQIDLAALDASAHGRQAETPLECRSCHQPADNFHVPHAPVTAADLRTFQIEQSANCTRCHQQPHLTIHPGPESEAPVVCTDCHGSHNVLKAETWRTGEGVATCANCHVERGVELNNADELKTLIQHGLFSSDRINNDFCLACHGLPGRTLTFANGDSKSSTIEAGALHDSVHGVNNSWQSLECTDCHENYTFPHEPVKAASLREYSLERYLLCARCHEDKYELTLDSTHGKALDEGNMEAAVCTDCHGAHDTPPPAEPRERISHTCQKCHSTIFDEYATSVHGEALLSESNPDVPTCIECHGVHNISDPTTNLFRIRSPQLCAGCHADGELMAEYEISTDVFETYVDDFHGTTVTLFEQQDPTVETNKAVCYDCHGVHNIHQPDDPQAGIKANLLATCQQCHPDASENFPDAWTSHFRPSLEHNPLVFLVDQFYVVFVPSVVGFLTLLVLTDVYRRLRVRAQAMRSKQ
ncbi:MAG: cytochrome c3 family protein [Chloroflexota bacterium]